LIGVDQRRTAETQTHGAHECVPGVPDELVDTVFDPFVRGKKAGAVGGSGVGLALWRRVLDALDGSIWHEPYARGASFKLRLPEPR
jgi:signal transduction histidine kinase